MINSNTSFGKLKSVIVGRELEITNTRLLDFTFKYFYKSNLNDYGIYDKVLNSYKLNLDVLFERINDLDNLEKILINLGIKTYRPKKLTKIIQIKTPNFNSEVNSANNVRDITLIYNNKIIEMPVLLRNRYFENLALYDIFNEQFMLDNKVQWIKSPNTILSELTLDIDDWKNKRDFTNIDLKYHMAIDGALFLRIGRDVIVNISTYNHYLGLEWVKRFFPDSQFHIVHIADNHIDGSIICLKPGVFLINKNAVDIINLLPTKFKSWKYLIADETNTTSNVILNTNNTTNIDVYLASSRGMDINILSIDENTCLVNLHAIGIIKLLEKEKFNVIPVNLRHCEIFGGGIHCSTLDLERDDEYIFYS